MNRQNFFGHLALALTIILVAAFAGQMRRWNNEHDSSHDLARENIEQTATIEAPPAVRAEAGRGPSEVIVRFRRGTSTAEIEALAGRLNDRVEDIYEHVEGYAVIEDEDGVGVAELVKEYEALPEVESVEENFLIERYPEPVSSGAVARALDEPPLTGPNDPLLGEQWALVNTGQREGKAKADIGALEAWAKRQGSEEVVVAVLDSGVNYLHPDLTHNIWVRPASLDEYYDAQLGTIDDERGYNAVDNDGHPMDENGHGTHCAGIVGAEGNNGEGIAGVNWKVQIMPLKFMNAGGFGTTKDAIEAINYTIARKKEGVNVRVISASWGSTQKSSALEAAIRRAGEEGILFVAAAGNSSVNNDRSPHYPSSYDLPNVLSVAALTRQDELASFSNYGARSVHVAAPGKEILSTWLGADYEEHSGTSMATPVVSGIAALILAGEPDLSVRELRERLINAVEPVESLRGKVASGGRISAARAVGAR